MAHMCAYGRLADRQRISNLLIAHSLRNVLQHHDQREKEYLYPVLDQQLDEEQSTSLAAQMDKHRETV